MGTPSDGSDRLDAIVEEIRVVAARALDRKKSGEEPIAVDALRDEIDREFVRSFDAYVAFLDEAGCLEIDHGGRRLRLRETIARPIKAASDWEGRVAEAFGDDQSPTDEQSAADGEGDEDDELETDETRPPGSMPGVSSSPSSPADSALPDPPTSPPDEHRNESTVQLDDQPDQELRMEEREVSTTGKRQYEYTREIGSGAFGTVYEGRDTNLERTVAIKKIRNVFEVFARLDREDVVERFREVTRAQARISHPAVVQIYDVETGEDDPFAVTEYAPNGNLRQLIEDDEQRTLSYALEYFIQILHGIHAAHERDLVHGNLKPENVVLDAAGNAKISDFGVTSIVALDDGAADEIYVGVGAPEYKPPEQIKTGEVRGVRSDIWALGILLYELLTGEIPSRRSPMPSEEHPQIPRAVDDIFDRMSLDDPEERYPSVEAVLGDIYAAEEIVGLLDRRSGVVHLADPLEHGRRPAVEDDGHLRPTIAEGAGRSVEPVEATSVGAAANTGAGRSREADSEPDAPDAGAEEAEPKDDREGEPAVSSPEEPETATSAPAADGGTPADGTEPEPPTDEAAEEKSSWSLF